MRYLNCWDNKNFFGAKSGPLTHASSVKYFLLAKMKKIFQIYNTYFKKRPLLDPKMLIVHWIWGINRNLLFQIFGCSKRAQTSTIYLYFSGGIKKKKNQL